MLAAIPLIAILALAGMLADACAPLLRSLRDDIPVQVIPGVGHIGLTTEPIALATIRTVFTKDPLASAR